MQCGHDGRSTVLQDMRAHSQLKASINCMPPGRHAIDRAESWRNRSSSAQQFRRSRLAAHDRSFLTAGALPRAHPAASRPTQRVMLPMGHLQAVQAPYCAPGQQAGSTGGARHCTCSGSETTAARPGQGHQLARLAASVLAATTVDISRQACCMCPIGHIPMVLSYLVLSTTLNC